MAVNNQEGKIILSELNDYSKYIYKAPSVYVHEIKLISDDLARLSYTCSDCENDDPDNEHYMVKRWQEREQFHYPLPKVNKETYELIIDFRAYAPPDFTDDAKNRFAEILKSYYESACYSWEYGDDQ